jgi:hypothetical protein
VSANPSIPQPAARPRRIAAGRLLAGALFVGQFVILGRAFGESAEPSLTRRASGWLASVVLWSLALAVARTRATRILVALVAALLVVLQIFVFRYYHVPLDLQVAEAARHTWKDIRPVIFALVPWFAGAVVCAGAFELALLELAPRVPRWASYGIAAALLVTGLLRFEPRRATPDLRAIHALRAVSREPRAPVDGAIPLPVLHSARPAIPSVLFILSESVRQEDYLPSGPSATAPVSAAMTAGRVDLEEMRSVSSYTAVSLSAVLTGRTQEGARDEVLRAANLFDFAHAVGMYVAYYSAQSRETFEAKDVRAAVDRFYTLEDIAGHEIDDDSQLVETPLDKQIVDRFIGELPSSRAPGLSVLHLYGTHAPYYFEDSRATFTPFERSVAWSKMEKLRNAYKNAILEQDRHVARAIAAFRDHVGPHPWLVVFTSDHGEAFGEHGAIHHGQNLYDEQVRVPGWIYAGPGTLLPHEAAALAEHRKRFVNHLDLLPTVLDAMGLAGNFAIQAYEERMRGRSLLRPYAPRGAIPVTNCTGMFRCPLNTWGLFAEDRKLVAQAWDAGWTCLDLGSGEHIAPPGDPACARLQIASREHFPLLPNGSPNR